MSMRVSLILGAACLWANLDAAPVPWIKIDGAIGPATVAYVSRGIAHAIAQKAPCLVIQLDTPGGLLDSTKDIVEKFYSSAVPIVVYVAPSGAHAASAGCFITIAADVAAMAPDTSIGAAHPVTVGGLSEQKMDDVMKQKMENFASAFIESIANKRKRNVEWAISSVKESAAITAEKALELKVIDLIAKDEADLFRQLNGREINGKTLSLEDAQQEYVPMSTREKLFQILGRPEVMFVLMLVAIYGLIGEMSNPGAVLPGVVGAIALILTLYMASILPINIAGLALIVLAVGLFIIDVFAPTHGVLTVGGIIAFFLGSLMLFDRMGPAFRLSLGLVIPSTLITAAFFTWVFGSGLRAQFLPVKTGKEAMVGKTVAALTPITATDGRVMVDGEYWSATSDLPIEPGQKVEIVGMRGLTLKVKSKA